MPGELSICALQGPRISTTSVHSLYSRCYQENCDAGGPVAGVLVHQRRSADVKALCQSPLHSSQRILNSTHIPDCVMFKNLNKSFEKKNNVTAYSEISQAIYCNKDFSERAFCQRALFTRRTSKIFNRSEMKR